MSKPPTLLVCNSAEKEIGRILGHHKLNTMANQALPCLTVNHMTAIPTVNLSIGPNRDYEMIMQQTKMVYDQLLADKNSKLVEALLHKKEEFDKQCIDLAKKSNSEAMEFGVRAQEYLNRMQIESQAELKLLQNDYQLKLDKMLDQMETQWKVKNGK